MKAHLQEAAKQEAKVEAIVQAEAHGNASETNKRDAVEPEANQEDINNNSEYNAIPCGIEYDSHAPYIMPPGSPIKTILPEINKNAVSEVADYDYVDYATF